MGPSVTLREREGRTRWLSSDVSLEIKTNTGIMHPSATLREREGRTRRLSSEVSLEIKTNVEECVLRLR